MSSNRDDVLQKAARGDRIRSIRDAKEMTGDQFAALLTNRMRDYGQKRRVDKALVSYLEKGERITLELAAILADMDPRGIEWLVFGEQAKGAKRHRPIRDDDGGEAELKRRRG